MDLMNQLSLEMGTSIRFLPIEWPDVFDTLESGQADFIQISYSEEREERYFLTQPLYNNKGIVLLHNDGNKIRTLEELRGMKIAGIHKDYAMEILEEKVPGLGIQEYNSIDECAKVLTAGLVDGIVSENKQKPYSDQKLCNLLKEHHIVLSRRAIAKYREETGIPGSFQRKG